MAYFFIANKMLILKILLATLCSLSLSYEYGYHPSAEEFDNFLRESSRTWTRDLLASERRRAFTVSNRDVRGHFVPKFNYETQRRKYESINPATVHTNNDRNDLIPAAANNIFSNVIPNVPTAINFHLFSDEVNVPNEYNSAEQNLPATRPPPQIFQQQPTQSPHHNPLNAKPQLNANNVNYLPHNYQNDKGNVSFPIFFTNPATGIVYAITEIGKSQNNTQHYNNNSIPIYITKEQYDRDIYLTRKHFSAMCTRKPTTEKPSDVTSEQSVLSSPGKATLRPQIIRLKRPTNQIRKPALAKLPTKLVNPPPVMLKSNYTINNQMQLPTTIRPSKPKKSKKKTKKNKRKNTRPGLQPISSLKTTTTQATLPLVVFGKPNQNTAAVSTTLATQVERPHASTAATIFSRQPIKKTNGYMVTSTSRKTKQKNNIKQNKMIDDESTMLSVSEEQAAMEDKKIDNQNGHTGDIINTTISQQPSGLPKYRIRRHIIPRVVTTDKTSTAETPNKSNDTAAYSSKMLEPSNETNSTNMRIKLAPKNFQNQAENAAARRSRYTVKSGSKSKTRRKTPSPPKISVNNKQRHNRTNLLLPAILFSTHNVSASRNSSTEANMTQIAARNRARTVATTPKQRANSKRKQVQEDSSEGGFNLFDLLSDDGDEDADYDDYYDDDDEEIDNSQRKPIRIEVKVKKRRTSSTTPAPQEYLSDEASDNNESSAEPDADFGALEEDYTHVPDYPKIDDKIEQNDKNLSSLTKANTSKKRIRRRPATESGESTSLSYEDDYDEDDEDTEDGSGVGGFFRMIFYPVQLVMSRVMDNIAGEESPVAPEKNYPPYTMYNSALKEDNSVDYDDSVDDSYSLSNWLTSWFGYARKTKKIGSTTVAPARLPIKPTKEPGWFDGWFGGGSKSTTDYPAEDENEENWFFGWFDTKPKSKSRRRTTTTTTTPTPQVPILTIVDPLKNPQNWIGILAHHIINSTSTSTQRPLLDAITRATTKTTTANPDVPRVINYDKYQIWRLKPQDDDQVKALEDLKKSEDGIKLQWLKGPSLRGLTDVLVPPKMFVDLQGSLSFESIAHEVLIFDVGKAIAYEKSKATLLLPTNTANKNSNKEPTRSPLNMSWHKYHEFDDIITHLEALRMRYTQIVELIHIGRSYEGRPLVVVKLEAKQTERSGGTGGTGNKNDAQKRLKHKRKSGRANAVFIEAGTHGMEWIGPATATWMINELLRIMRSNKTNPEQNFIKQTTWYIMPVLNPDGYVYSHDYDRFWKKSRSRHIQRPPNGILNTAMDWWQQRKKSSRVCYGVDLDRNWRYQWGKRGSSKSACNEFYAGPTAFSEPETKALADFLMEQRSQIKLYMSLQSYGQLLSFPLKANATFASERMDDLLDVAMVGVDGLRRNGSKSRYRIDSSNDLVEHRSGCSDAFSAYELGIPYSYTLQLADNGVHGYLLPSTSITTTARDAFEIVTAMLDYI